MVLSRTRFAISRQILLLFAVVTFATSSKTFAQKGLTGDDAKRHAGENAHVTFTAEATHHLADRDIVFLNSKKDYKHEDNFTVVIYKEGLEDLRKNGIKNPAVFYREKLIGVKGVIQLRSGRPQIIVTRYEQILSPVPATAANRGVGFLVKSSHFLKDKQIVFLNSEKDHKNEKNFTIVIFKEGIASLKAKGIANPAEYYLNKQIDVDGDVESRNGKLQIRVEDAKQIRVLKPPEK